MPIEKKILIVGCAYNVIVNILEHMINLTNNTPDIDLKMRVNLQK